MTESTDKEVWRRQIRKVNREFHKTLAWDDEQQMLVSERNHPFMWHRTHGTRPFILHHKIVGLERRKRVWVEGVGADGVWMHFLPNRYWG